MRDDWQGGLLVDQSREPALLLYQDTTWAELTAGIAGDPFDLAPYLTAGSQSAREMRVTLAYSSGLDGHVPAPGDLVSLRESGQIVWQGIVESIDDHVLERGAHSLSFSARSRDGMPVWRSLRWATDIYPLGTDLQILAIDVAKGLGLEPHEYAALQPTGRYVPHSTMQLAELSGWEMLAAILAPVGMEPAIDAVGRLKPISRDLDRAADLDLDEEHVLRVRGSKSRPPITDVRLLWLDPALSKSTQQDQVLATTGLTAGFFKLDQTRNVYWSEDRRQRAQNTYMRVIASINDGLLPVGDERYVQRDEFRGVVTVTTSAWVPSLATASLVGLLVASEIPDEVNVSSAITIPLGRVIHAAAEIVILLILMSLGTGSYEIWGEPFDFVHAVNTTHARAADIDRASRSDLEIRSDFVADEAHATAFAARELLYAALSAASYSFEMVDFPALERGDIVRIAGGVRVYVTDYQREIARGAPAVLRVSGFRV